MKKIITLLAILIIAPLLMRGKKSTIQPSTLRSFSLLQIFNPFHLGIAAGASFVDMLKTQFNNKRSNDTMKKTFNTTLQNVMKINQIL